MNSQFRSGYLKYLGLKPRRTGKTLNSVPDTCCGAGRHLPMFIPSQFRSGYLLPDTLATLTPVKSLSIPFRILVKAYIVVL